MKNVVHNITRLLVKIKKEDNISSRIIEERVSDILKEFKNEIIKELKKENKN